MGSRAVHWIGARWRLGRYGWRTRMMTRLAVTLLTAVMLAGAILTGTLGRSGDEAFAATISINRDEEIVYLDGDHVIRVYDPHPSSDLLVVEWHSPEGGWDDFALGDLTGDGDMEIVAIRKDGDGGLLTVFDPVAQDSPLDQVEEIGGVPWARLFDLELPRPPRLIATGEFDRTRPGHEILYSVPEAGGFDRFTILRSTGEGLPGRAWEEVLSWEQEGRWSAIATGNVLVEDALDEIGLVSEDRAELGLLRISPALNQVFTHVNREHQWTDVAIGQFALIDGDGAEIGAVRDADLPLSSGWVFRYNGTNFVDFADFELSPSPTHVFFADIGGNGDDEILMLRQVTPELGPRARLIVRDGNNNDTFVVREELLDGDNAYKGGDGGDIDGDGRDEIVLVRNNRIRIYHAPENSLEYELVKRFTNGETVLLGNLDAAGLAQQSILYATRRSLQATLAPGEEGDTLSVTLVDAAKGFNLQYEVRIEDAAEWIRVTPRSGQTPDEIEIRFDAREMSPGQYTGRLVIDVTASNVVNDPLTIELALTVEAVVDADPASVDFVYFPCTEPLEPQEQAVALTASRALSYTAAIEGNPDWVTVAPEAGVLPEEVTVSIDPARRPADLVATNLLITVDLPGVSGVVNRVPIFLACPAYRLFAPVIGN